jgi:hypothetical protein
MRRSRYASRTVRLSEETVEVDFDATDGGASIRPEFAVASARAYDVAQGLQALGEKMRRFPVTVCVVAGPPVASRLRRPNHGGKARVRVPSLPLHLAAAKRAFRLRQRVRASQRRAPVVP